MKASKFKGVLNDVSRAPYLTSNDYDCLIMTGATIVSFENLVSA